jgi:hypothetical protein
MLLHYYSMFSQFAFVFRMLEKEKEDMSKKKKYDQYIMHGIKRSFQTEEYVAQVRLDLHSTRAREKRERIAAMMKM